MISPEERQNYLEDARGRYVNAIQAIDQVTNKPLPADAIRAGAALAEANISAAWMALELMKATA